jgi:hypothetical protein
MNTDFEADKYLLQHDFNRLLVNKQAKIWYILTVGIRKGFFGKEELEDAIQEINKRLLEKSEHFQRNYNGLSTVDAYLQVIILNECRRYSNNHHHAHDMNTNLDENKAAIADRGINPEEELIIIDEIKRLDLIMKLYPRQRFQIELFLKLLCRFPVTENDISQVYPNINLMFYKNMVEKINGLMQTSDVEIFRIFANLLSEAGIEHSQHESLLHAAKEKIKQIISLMNSRTKTQSNYDQKSFLFLAEKYFSIKATREIIQFINYLAYILPGISLFNNL